MGLLGVHWCDGARESKSWQIDSWGPIDSHDRTDHVPFPTLFPTLQRNLMFKMPKPFSRSRGLSGAETSHYQLRMYVKSLRINGKDVIEPGERHALSNCYVWRGRAAAKVRRWRWRRLVASTHWCHHCELIIMAEASFLSCAGDDEDLSPIQIASTETRMPHILVSVCVARHIVIARLRSFLPDVTI